MSLSRTALRMQTVLSLRGTGLTIANKRVFDSRVDDFAPESRPGDAEPTIIVLTDEDEGDALSKQNGGPPFERTVSLVIEFAMVQTFEHRFVDEEDGQTKTAVVPGYPSTDAEHEAMLDLLEFQIMARLLSDLNPNPVQWRKLARVWKYDCHRQVVNDAGVKLAARILTLQCEIGDDEKRVINVDKDNPPAGLDALPEPLRTVALGLPPGPMLDLCMTLATAINPIEAVAFDGMDMRITAVQDLQDMLNMSIEVASALDTPQIVVTDGICVIDYARGDFQNLILASNVTDISIINWPKNYVPARLVLKITNTGVFNIDAAAWPAEVKWVNGVEISVTPGASKVDMIVLVTGSAGAEIFANIVGQDYQP